MTGLRVRLVMRDSTQLIEAAYPVKSKTNFVSSVIVKGVRNAHLASSYLTMCALLAK